MRGLDLTMLGRWMFGGFGSALMVALLWAHPVRAADAGKPPLTVVRELIEAIRSFERPAEGAALSPIQQKKNRGIVERAHAHLDFDGLAQRSLGSTWEGLKPKERTEFIDLLKTLFAEVAYPESSKFFGALDVETDDGAERGDLAVVEASVSHPDEGLVDLEFFLRKIDGHYKVVEMDLDGVSLAADIRNQIQKILKKESYPELLERMRDRLAKDGISAKAAEVATKK